MFAAPLVTGNLLQLFDNRGAAALDVRLWDAGYGPVMPCVGRVDGKQRWTAACTRTPT